MGHRQTPTHRSGKNSQHQIGLVYGQFADDMKRERWLAFLEESGFDGYEEAAWTLGLDGPMENSAIEQLAADLYAPAKQRNLGIFTVAAHLHGQALGDEPSAKTLNFVGGEAALAYCEWREAGNEPPVNDPFFVPENVGKLIHSQALHSLVNTVKLASYLGRLQGRKVPVSGFVGSPAGRWNHWFAFPSLPQKIGKFDIPNVHAASKRLLVDRFSPVWQACLDWDTTYDLECHPSEIAMGDIASAAEYLATVDDAGFSKACGFNFDNSHMEWQGVSGIEFVRRFGNRIHCVHLKGVQVAAGYTDNGLLGGHRPMGDACNGWNFVSAGSARDAVNLEALIVELNRAGYDGALNIEWEDGQWNLEDGARAALAATVAADKRPSDKAHDAALKAQ